MTAEQDLMFSILAAVLVWGLAAAAFLAGR
jgi:hypothetical protein